MVLTVLVVEDEPLLRMIAVAMIEDAGFVALDARTAIEAFNILESRPDISLLFTDVDMPGGMDGVELTILVGEKWPLVKKIVTSGYHELSPNSLPHDVPFFRKPYRERDVIAVMRQLTT